MDIDFLLIFFIARYLTKTHELKEKAPAWDRKLKLITYISLALFVAGIVIENFSNVMFWLGKAALLYCAYLLYKEPIFKLGRSIVLAIVPYIVTSVIVEFIRIANRGFYKEWSDVLDSINTFAILWGVGVWLVTGRQRKELDKVKARIIEEEKNSRLMAMMKDELEVQVAERTAELTKQKEELEVALNELKSAQAQLIHSEKMASLGELTAGIAHEIQNPLNFVNNFSEVSKELLDEMKQELDSGNMEDAKELADGVIQNLEKINHHGKRADAIVKGMLQHSRTNSGQMELTDINTLADEYLRLAYHGLRAKDKSFNAKFETDFDSSIGKINMIPQDIGRVILNLINNAFYAVSEKKAALNGAPFEPTVILTTKRDGNRVYLKVTDNGNGIPQKVIDKIFQPFFTTKPTGQGTGLGLSLSYDIVTKLHGGELKVETKEGEGTTFIIILPYLNELKPVD